MEFVLHTFIDLVTGFLIDAGFLEICGSDVSDLDVRVAIDSLTPGARAGIEIHTDEIEYKGKKRHLGMPKEGDDDTDDDNDDGREGSHALPDIRSQGFEDCVADSRSGHDNRELSDTQIEKNLILIFNLDGDFVLHKPNFVK